MASEALVNLFAALDEVKALQRANPSPAQGGGFSRPQVARAIGRAEVVLLCSHFERYLYALNEESVAHLLSLAIDADRLSEELRLVHSRDLVDQLGRVQWNARSEKLRYFSATESALWRSSTPLATLDHERLLAWMKAPTCKSIVRAFRMWGIDDIFRAITRTPVNRQRLWLRLTELVDKRNAIAHGDLTVEARYLDIRQYQSAVRTFCTRADRRMSLALAAITERPRPWD